MRQRARRISLQFFFLLLGALAAPNSARSVDEVGPAAPEAALVPGKDDDAQTVAVGNIKTLDFEFEPRVIIGNPTLMKGEIDQGNPRQVRLTPIKKGTTDVLIQDQRGKLVRKINYNIITNDLSQKVEAIRKLLNDVEGITIESVDEKIVIDGELIVPRDFDRILQVQQAYPDTLNLVALSRISKEAIARRMQKEINDDPDGVNVTIKIINDTFFLFGKVDSSQARERAETVAQTYVPELVNSAALKEGVLVPGAKKFSIRNMIMVEEAPAPPPPKMVRVTYHFVEIGKEYLKSSFFKWSPLLTEQSGMQIGAGTAGGVASSGSFNGLVTSLIPKLQAGANGGFARVLFSTVTIGMDKEQVEVLRTDNIPYVSAVINGQPVPDNVPVGIQVKVTPEILGEDKVQMRTFVQFEAFAGNGAGGKPRTTKTTLTNVVMVKTGESAALGGLISSDTSKDIDKDPEQAAAGGSPLFTLLRSKSFRNKKTQFVVFITPKIIADAAEGTADIKGKILNNSQKKRRRVVR